MTRLKKMGLAFAGVVAVLVAFLAAIQIWGRVDPQHLTRTLGTEDPAAVLVAKPAPDFTLPRIGKDGEVSLSDYRGKIVIIDFWATWCGPCERTSPHLETIRASNDDVVVIAINIREGDLTPKEREKLVVEYIAERAYGFEFVAGDQKLMDAYNTQSIPHLFIVDEEGIIRYSGLGAHSEENLVKALASVRG